MLLRLTPGRSPSHGIFERAEEALGQRVVPALAGPPVREPDLVVVSEGGEVAGGVLTAAVGVEDHLVVAYIRRTLSRPMHAAGSPLRLRTRTALPPPETGMYMSRWPTGSTTSLTAVPSSSCSVVAGPEYESWMIQA